MYPLVRALVRALVRCYYRVEIVGERPAGSGPVILVGNHSNGLIDGGMMLDFSRRPLHVLIKVSLMRMPLFGAFLRAGGAIALQRRKDGPDMSRNEVSFERIHAALEKGEPIVLFPEGTSTHTADLGPFKTGAARMALEAERRADFALKLRILPLGLVYEDMYRFRSRAVAVVGEPFGISGWQADAERDERAAVAGLTAQIEQAIRSVAQTGSSFEELAERQDAESVAAPDGRTRHERWRAIAARQRQRGEQRLASLAELRRAAASLGLPTSEALRLSRSPVGWLRWLLAAPWVLAGVLLWAPPLLLARTVTRLAPLTPDKHVSTLLLCGWLLIPLWLLGLGLWAWLERGPLLGLLVPLTALLMGRVAVVGWRSFCAPSFLVPGRMRAPLERATGDAEALLHAELLETTGSR